MGMKQILALCLSVVLYGSSVSAQQAAAGDGSPDLLQPALDRLASLVAVPLPDWRFHDDLPHPEIPALNDADWPVLPGLPPTDRSKQTHWKSTHVFRRWIEIPKNIHGYDPRESRVKLDLAFESEGDATITVFANGSMIFRGDEDTQQPMPLTENAQPGQRFLIAARVDAGNVETALVRAGLIIEPPASRPDPALIDKQIASARPLIGAYPDGRDERQQQLEAAAKAIDFSLLDKGDQAGFDASLRQAQTKLEALRPWLQQFTIRAVGNSHIDMAWLWPWTETVEVVRNTFRSVLDLMREYPDFKFTMSSARTYEWMEEKYPDLFQEIEQRVKEGRWEIVGGMWVEPDLNMPAGESLVRQILVGKRYFQQKFGVDVRIGWNPDSFGYNWQLPQIYKKSGMDYFVTQKLLWAHEFTTFPYKLFWWQSPDGSRILTYFPHDYASSIDAESMAKDLSVWAPSMYGTKTQTGLEVMHLYGVGDHGGGPTRTMLDNAEQLMSANVVYPNLNFGTAAGFFKDLEQELPTMQVPTWNDELYFQYHRGVMTTQAETKRRIRRTEGAVLNAEEFSSLAHLFGQPYPQEQMEDDWKRLLFDHFHDIMPGSGIAVNYLDAKRNLEDVNVSTREITDAALKEIAAHVNTQGDGVPVVIFNSLSWPRTEVVQIEVQLSSAAKHVQVVDLNGKPVDSQLLSIDPDTHRAQLLVLASAPAVGYTTYFVRATAKPPMNHALLKASADTLENEFIRVKVDPRSGCMLSLFDKRSGTEALAPAETDTGGPKDRVCGDLLQTFVDKPKRWDAWNIDADFEKQHWDLDHADEVALVENGPLRAVIRVKNHFQNSTFVRDITMYAGVQRVDVNMHADWHEKHILLKVAFPVSAHNSKATYEIPFGSIERPTTRNTPAEQAEFEVPAQRWADISDDKHGFSLLNDCKYGYDAKGNVLRLSLLRSPEWPDPHADEGVHEFTFSLYPHAGNWRDALTVQRGYELNDKLIALSTENHQGVLAADHSFLQLNSENVVMTAMKKAEDGDALIVRFYEWAGKEGDVTLQLPAAAEQASDTDLMERTTGALSPQGNSVTVHTKPYEIKTVRIQLAPNPGAASAQVHR
jgi:alpha-mannosidase